MDFQYDKKAVLRYLALLLAAIAVWKVTSGVGALLVTFFVIGAVLREKPIEMLFWVLFMTYSSAGNRQLLVANGISFNPSKESEIVSAFMHVMSMSDEALSMAYDTSLRMASMISVDQFVNGVISLSH